MAALPSRMQRVRRRIGKLAGPLVVLLIFVSSLWLLGNLLEQYRLRDLLASVAKIPARQVWAALGLTVINYLVLIGYDYLGIKYIRHPMALGRIALASFLGYAVGNNFGTLLGGTTIRYRLYTSWGLSAVEIVKLVLILGMTFWIGVFALAGVVFVVEPIPIPSTLRMPISSTRPLGVVLSVVAIGYPILCALRRRPMRIGKWQIVPPPVGLSLLQYSVATLDLMVAASVLYMLMPPELDVPYFQILAIYLLGIVATFVTQVPGGLGVLELIMLVLLAPEQPDAVMGALLAFRLIYHLLPLAIGLVVLVINEIALHREHARRILDLFGRLMPVVAPRVLAISAFLAGTVLLLSDAMPAAENRLQWLQQFLPLAVLEASHFLAGIVAVFFLVLARGLQRRLEAAYSLTIIALAVAILLTLFKGFDYEVALLLAVLLAILFPCRHYFYRREAALTERFTAQWLVAVSFVFACTIWMILFAYKNIIYRDELWWQFAINAHLSRSLRAVAGAGFFALVVIGLWLLRPKTRSPQLPGASELHTARNIIARSSSTLAHLALLGDKNLLFNPAKSAFIMFGVEGRSWVSLGDPVGDPADGVELAWDFRERCEEAGAWPVFYQVDALHLPIYLEMGLATVIIGEEARVPLGEFDLQSESRKELQQQVEQLAREKYRLEIVPPGQVPPLLPQLRQISDAWLAERGGREKGFSIGFFQPEYLAACPLALVRHHGQIVAFANLWEGAQHEELSLDLLRYVPQARPGILEFTLSQIMLWGRREGYRWLNLGMAPLAGIESQPLAPLWNRVATLTYRHGEHFENFHKLRQFKDSFQPVWRSKFLVSPGGLVLPLILANVTTLINGDVKKRRRRRGG